MLSHNQQVKINLSNLNELVLIARMDLKHKTSRVIRRPSKATEKEAMDFRQISKMVVGLQEPCEVKADHMDRFYPPQIL